MEVDGKLTGIEAMERLLDTAAGMVASVLMPVVEAGAEVLAEAAADSARTISQRGGDSITTERRDSLTVAVGPTKQAYWMRFHEWGTRYLAADGWFRRAFDQSFPAIKTAMADVFKARIGLFK